MSGPYFKKWPVGFEKSSGLSRNGPQRGVAVLSVASCYRNRDKLRSCGPPWLVCDFTLKAVQCRFIVALTVLQCFLKPLLDANRSPVLKYKGLVVVRH